jgi:hypothetical protein
LAENLIRTSIAANIPENSFPARLSLPGWPEGQPPLCLECVQSADGWLAIALD